MPCVGFILLFVTATVISTSASVTPITPIDKVIKLLVDLKASVTTQGASEASIYDDFACFCKSMTGTKSTAITSGHNTIKTTSSEIADKTARKEDKIIELKKRQQDHEDWSRELAKVEATFAKDKSDYQAKEADLSKALSSLGKAIHSMESSKSFLAVRESVVPFIELAGVMNLIPESKRRALDAFLQTTASVDPSDAVYKFHSQGILDVLNNLLTDFRNEKQTVDSEWGKTQTTYNGVKSSLQGKISANSAQINTLKDNIIPNLEGEIANARRDLVNAEASLKDDQAYLKDLTQQCETRANDWDQRSALRGDELKKLDTAINILQNDVKGHADRVNQRAMLIESSRSARPSPTMAKVSLHEGALSFVQEVATKGRSHSMGANAEAAALTAKQSRASAYLRGESERLSSAVLSSTAVHLEADPFDKVKTLIQGLIERLLRESTDEATKKGFCDENLGKAQQDRDYRLQESKDLSQEIKAFQLKRDELEAEIAILNSTIVKLQSDLQVERANREQRRQSNNQTLHDANEGLVSLREALEILQVFYKSSARARVSLLQASPVDEDTTGAGFEGAYLGRQESSKAIIGLLKVIESDFDRTVRFTEAEEARDHAEFIEFERTSKADISGKTEKQTLSKEDLVVTQDALSSHLLDLQSAQDLLDGALKTLEALKPTCVDTGMSYLDRVKKREDEIDALRRALCILDTEGVESQCQGQSP